MKRPRTVLLLFVVAFLVGCHSSNFPITDVDNSVVDSKLLGRWVCTKGSLDFQLVDKDEDKKKVKSETLEVFDFNGREYYVEYICEYTDKSINKARLRAFNSVLDKQAYLNLQNLAESKDRSFVYFTYHFLDNQRLELQFIKGDGKGGTSIYKEQAELIDYIKTNQTNKDFLSSPVIFTKKP